MEGDATDWYLHLHEFLYTKGEETSGQETRLILDALELRPGSRVLDAPCATGRIAVRLARAGISVTGVDINRGFLARAAARLGEEGLTGSFCAMDLRRLAFREAFDGVCNWWASFGYFPDAENLQALRGMAAALRPGGRLVIEQPNRQLVIRYLQPVATAGPWTLHSRWDSARQRIESTWILDEEGRAQVYPMSMRWYTLAQFRDLFRRAGLELVATYGAYDGRPYRAGSPRLIVVGQKPSPG